MADVYDQATQREERDRELAVNAAMKAAPGPTATGRCLFKGCGEPLADGARFCGPECRDAFDKAAARLART